MRERNGFKIAVCILFVTVFMLSAYKITDYYLQEKESDAVTDSLIELAVETVPDTEAEHTDDTISTDTDETNEHIPIAVDFERLWQENKDIIAWIYCPDTEINYPVVQSSDNSYYLRRLLNGKWNIAGSIFADYRNASNFTDFHTVIYGHNMKNDTMFGTLPEYSNQEYYEQHPVWYLITPEKNYRVDLIAGFVTSRDSVVYGFKRTQEERDEIVKLAMEKSKFLSDAVIFDNDKVIAFSTCSYEYDNARFVVMGVLRIIE